jgi:TP901 family phage tail tape measure protein
MPNYDLGTAHGQIEIDASTLGRAISALDSVSGAMLKVGAVAGLALGYAIKSAADFEQQMSRFQAATHASGQNMDLLREKALQLGRDSAYGATEVAKAFAELAYAGASTKEIIQGLGDATVYLAAAGEIPLADASRTLINTMRQFNIPAKDAVNIANELARAANASTIDVTDLTTSLRYAGPVAAALHIPFRQVAETLAILGNEGIRGSTAGTSLRGILIALTPTSQKAADTMRELGLITADGANQFFTAAGKIKSMSEIAQILQDHTKNLTDEQKKQAFTTIFQRRAMASALALADGGAAAYDKLAKSQQYNTTAQEIMRKKLDNLNGSLKILKSSLETFAITIGEKFQGPLKAAADGLRDLTNWFAALPDDVKTGIAWTLAAFVAFLLLGGILFKLGVWTLRAYRAFKTLATGIKIVTTLLSESSVAALTNPYVLLAVVIIAAVAALVLLFVYWNKVWSFLMDNKWLIGVIAILMGPVSLILVLVGLLHWLYDNWDSVWSGIKTVAKAVWDWLKTAASDVTDWIQQAWQDVVNFLTKDVPKFFEELPGKIQHGLEAAGQAIINFIEGIPDFIQRLPLILQGLASAAITWLAQAGVNVIVGFWHGMVSALTFIADFLISLPATLLGFFGSVASWLVGPGLQLLLGFLFGAVEAFGNFVGWVVGDMIPWIFTAFANTVVWLLNAGIDLIQGFWNGAILVWNAVMGWLGGFVGNIFTAIGNLLGTLRSTGNDLIQGLWNGATDVWNQVIGWLEDLPTKAVGALISMGRILKGVGEDAINGLWEGMKSIATHVLSWAKNFANDVVDFIKDPLSIFSPSRVMKEVGVNIMRGLQIGMEKEGSNVLDFARKFAEQIPYEVTGAVTLAAGGAPPVGAGVLAPAPVPSRQTTVQQQNTIYAWNAREAAQALEDERAWAERTAGVA